MAKKLDVETLKKNSFWIGLGAFALFWLIGDLCSAESPMLFPSDLAALGDLTELQQAELYDNLLFNFYVDSDGNILEPDFFTTPENVTVFEVNTHLEELAPAVLDVLRQRVDDFTAEERGRAGDGRR